MASDRPTSEGVRRVLDAAKHRAGGSDDSSVDNAPVTAAQLLLALWDDESRAYEILQQAGVTEKSLAARLAKEAGEVDQGPASHTDTPSITQDALRKAQSLAGQLGRHAEVGTEHLLMALIECDPELAAWLAEQGVSTESLRGQVTDAQGLSDEPIAVDIALRPAIRTERETVRVDRILDAAANRCREGLRVVEDFTRFVLDDAHLSRILKELRHAFTAALKLLPEDRLLAARDTAGDVGTDIQTSAEQHREHALDVVRANCKRVEESLRTLEEYAKTESPDAASRFEVLRYRFYTIEQAVTQTFRAAERLQDARLYLLVTDRLCPQGAGPVIREALQGGVDVVQLREKEMPDARLLDLARSVRQWTAAADALFIVNDRPDIAALCEADGVHLGQDDMDVRDARQIVGGNKLIGVSTHTIQQARQAVIDGADYLGVGPVFPSATKAFDAFPGLAFVKEVAAEITRPWYPLGGINEQNVDEVISAGASRVAVSGAIASATDPGTTASNLSKSVG